MRILVVEVNFDLGAQGAARAVRAAVLLEEKYGDCGETVCFGVVGCGVLEFRSGGMEVVRGCTAPDIHCSLVASD
jgi:hypothetical protein